MADRYLGGIRDAHDPNDALFAAPRLGTMALPQEVGHLQRFRRWRSQGATSSCVGHGTAQLLEACRVAAGLPEVAISRLGLYLNARLYLGLGEIQDSGSRPRDALRGASKLGVVSEERWPLDLAHVNTRLPAELEAAGIAARFPFEYQRVGLGLTGGALVEAVLDALVFGPVGWGRMLRRSYMDHVGSGVLPAPRASEDQVGGHFTVLTGYRMGGDQLQEMGSWDGWGYTERVEVQADRVVKLQSMAWQEAEALVDGWGDFWRVRPVLGGGVTGHAL